VCPKCGARGWMDELLRRGQLPVYRCRACKCDWFEWPGDDMQAKCSHKFIDSNHCLKCGWVPPNDPR